MSEREGPADNPRNPRTSEASRAGPNRGAAEQGNGALETQRDPYDCFHESLKPPTARGWGWGWERGGGVIVLLDIG